MYAANYKLSKFIVLINIFVINHPVSGGRGRGNSEFGKEVSKVWSKIISARV